MICRQIITLAYLIPITTVIYRGELVEFRPVQDEDSLTYWMCVILVLILSWATVLTRILKQIIYLANWLQLIPCLWWLEAGIEIAIYVFSCTAIKLMNNTYKGWDTSTLKEFAKSTPQLRKIRDASLALFWINVSTLFIYSLFLITCSCVCYY